MAYTNHLLNCRSSLFESNILWSLSIYLDALMKIDLDQNLLLNIYPIPGDNIVDYGHIKMIRKENKIYIFPLMGKGIFCFNTIDESYERIDIGYDEVLGSDSAKFNIADCYNDKIVMVGHDLKKIYIGKIGHLDDWKEIDYDNILRTKGLNSSECCISNCYVKNEHVMFIPIISKNCLMVVDCEADKVDLEYVSPDKDLRIRTITRIGNDYLLTTTEDEKIVWNPESGMTEIKKLSNLKEKGFGYQEVLSLNRVNYYIPLKERRIFIEDERGIRILPFDYPERLTLWDEYETTQFEMTGVYEDIIYFQPRSTGQFFMINNKTGELTHKNIQILQDVKEVIKRLYPKRRKQEQSEFFSFDIEQFISFIAKK